ncbi:hypothetical protein F5Y06DRAFT_308074 [Hypoxylon sp. FL0890]|nr:hypothetical protein F5Y06DRAFT_308074 [Hypoxylon sp. FL0890]
MTDLRSIRWARAGLWTLYALWVTIILGLFTFLIIYATDPSAFEDLSSACRSDGSFALDTSSYNVWKGFFEIGLGFGNLNFTQAKVVDIAWDITIGRWGQVLMAFISWRVFANYVTTSMESAPVTYTVFSTIFLENEPSLFSTLGVARSFISGHGLKSKVAMAFLISSMLFLIGWPTFASAMTGYATISEAFVPDVDNNYISLSDFLPIAYIIHDAWRINLTGNYPVSFLHTGSRSDMYDVFRMHFKSTCFLPLSYDRDASSCFWQNATSQYVSTYGFFGLQNTTSLWINTTLPSPVLNISPYYLPDYEYYGFNWTDPRSMGQNQLSTDPSNMAFTYNNNTYQLSYIKDNGTCQPVRDRYKWGFSFVQVFLVVTVLAIWTIGTYIMWLKARFQLPLQGQVEIPRGWRSVLILAENMNKQLLDAGIDALSLTDRQLKQEIKKQLHGGSVSFDSPLTKSGYSFRRAAQRAKPGLF